MSNYIRWFKDIGIDDIPLVGGKNASLGEMYQTLTPSGVRIPNGYAITAEAYRFMLEEANAWDELRNTMAELNPDNVQDLAQRGARARDIIYHAGLPTILQTQIIAAYATLQQEYGDDVSLAVRSSATAEDLPTASFAGQQETYLNIRGEEQLLDACRRCFASLFTDRAIHYRSDQGFDHFDVGLSIGIMKMVRSDIAASGVIFTLDTESGFSDVVFITGAYGLGENVVQGNVEPDEFYVHKPTFLQGHRAVLSHHLGSKKIKMIYAAAGSRETTMNVDASTEERQHYCINDNDVLQLADYAIRIEQHYSAKHQRPMPMDIEWAKDGVDGELYILQARPETAVSQRQTHTLIQYQLKGSGDVLTQGYAIGNKIATGHPHYIRDVSQLHTFIPGEILLADTTTPDWEPVMKTAAAIVTNRGGRTCHAAIVARELGIPAVVGCNDATQKLINSDSITVSCAEGDEGKIYDGNLPFDVIETELKELPTTTTKTLINLGNPDLAFALSALPCDGVGLARMEFIINEYIKAHPMALLYPEKISNTEQRTIIKNLIAGNKSGEEFFIKKLSEAIGTIAAAFWPRPVIVRMSDFKSNEYASLLGGADFEPAESNPMIGFRGASRYSHPLYKDAFRLECLALQRTRNDMGLNNIKPMIPFCRRVEEGQRVLQTMAEFGLERGRDGLEIYMMVEIPNNAIQIEAFAELFDGFSIGSNDLTQLTLGVDRESELLAEDFDEQDAGVKQLILMTIEGAHKHHRHVGICGQAPSDYPEFAAFLVELGIDSISLNPDTLIRTKQYIAQLEKSGTTT